MSIRRIGDDDVENFTLHVHPSRTYVSSSTGVTGSVDIFARASVIEKDVQQLSLFNEQQYNEDDPQTILNSIKESTSTNISDQMSSYLSKVNALNPSVRKQQRVDITRTEPSVSFTRSTVKKNVIKNVLYPYYRCDYPTAHWSYTNYHTLNFFTASSVPSNTALLYPNSSSFVDGANVSGSYVLSNAFTFEFYINPRYTTDSMSDGFKAGTIFHLSSSYAVSLITGSSVDSTLRPDGYRIQLQVLNGATIKPSIATAATPLTFISDDNSLLRNRWHHVAIRWSANVDNKTGSFIIDGVQRGIFVIPSSSITPAMALSQSNPDVLVVGNFYEGNNSGSNSQSYFFNENIASREGLLRLVNVNSTVVSTPDTFTFNHPLNAEIHELKIHNTYISTDELSASMFNGPINTGSLIFYVPPFFTRESPNRQPAGTNGNGWLIGGIMQTPFQSIAGTTVDPFNIALSFGVGGKLVNLENFTRDFATKRYPRLLHLSASEIGTTVSTALSANSILYDEQTSFFSGSIRKRNATILPNDNGRFKPNYFLLASSSLNLAYVSGTNHDKYRNDLGVTDLSLISISEMFFTGAGVSFDSIADRQSGSLFDSIAGASPESVGLAPGDVYTVYQRTLDASSNIISIFDISNLYYGKRIQPNSFMLADRVITGTNGKVNITLRDNGYGNLYRADCLTTHASWSNVGDVLYNEGLAVVKSPALPFFGTDAFTCTFNGDQNIHILKLNAQASAGAFNSSSNPSHRLMSSSLLAHETDASFVYINGVNFHDDNMNVVLKTRFAQPVIKRTGDSYLIKVKLDF